MCFPFQPALYHKANKTTLQFCKSFCALWYYRRKKKRREKMTIITTAEAAELSRRPGCREITRRGIIFAIRRGYVKAEKFGRDWQVDKASFLAFVSAKRPWNRRK